MWLVNYLKILLARILHEVSERGMTRDEQFGFRSRHSTSVQLAHLERITRSLGEKRLTGSVFLGVAKAFDTVWMDCLYTLTLLHFLSYTVHTISPYLRGRKRDLSVRNGVLLYKKLIRPVHAGTSLCICFFYFISCVKIWMPNCVIM
jgi:hypothetical protein